MVRKHAVFDPASQKQLGSRLRSPRPSVEEPCPLSLSHGFLTTLPSLSNAKPACFRNTQSDPSYHFLLQLLFAVDASAVILAIKIMVFAQFDAFSEAILLFEVSL
jgi:hypothetical protein